MKPAKHTIAAALMSALFFVLPLAASAQQKTSPSTKPVAPASINCRATFSTGSGLAAFAVCVSDHGNMGQFSVGGVDQIFSGNEGYAVCLNNQVSPNGYDVGYAEAGFGAATISQPNPGAFPITITRQTLDGVFRLKQVWAKPDKKEHDANVAMTVTNTSGSTVNGVLVARSADIDANGTATDDWAAKSGDSLLQFENAYPSAISLDLLSYGVGRITGSPTENDWYVGGRSATCGPFLPAGNPTGPDQLVSGATYFAGSLAPGKSTTLTIGYSRR